MPVVSPALVGETTGSRGRQEGNPAMLPVVSTMSPRGQGGTLVHMPPSTRSPSGDGAAPPDGALPQWQQVQTLRVADVVMTILKARKTMPSATAASVSRTKHGDGFLVLVSLLEESPQADTENLDGGIDGAVAIFVARELGDDLASAFGDKDVIILQ
jgi:hypothetical protein